MKKNLRFYPWFIWLIELIVLMGGGYKLLALQTNQSHQLEEAWLATKDLYQIAISTNSIDLNNPLRNSIYQKITDQLGTQKTYCKSPARLGYQATIFSIEGLDPVPGIQTKYGSVVVPCEKEWIEVKPGKVGKLKKIQERIDHLEFWFIFLGIILMALKLVETYNSSVNGYRPKNKKNKKFNKSSPR